MEYTLEDKILKVSEFNELFDKIVSYQSVIIEGEISQINISQSKWLFVTIKDQNSQIEIFALAYSINTLPMLKEGMLVHVYGTPHIHQKSGRFRITADQIIPTGTGNLKIAFELLKQKLEKEGLFSPERKRPIITYPSKIALITAENSQAYHDFIKIIDSRTGDIKIYFFPVSVQGADSVKSIVKAFKLINDKYLYLDFAVLTRGGGSLEDLQAFNSEEVARAVFSSKIPVVSAIGHEKDISLSDLASDLRASTPSNAAELVSRDKYEITSNIAILQKHFETIIDQTLGMFEEKVSQSLSLIDSSSKEVFYKFENLKAKIKTNLEINRNLIIKEQELQKLERIIKSLSFENTLKRGYSITYKNGKIIRDVKSLVKGDIINTRLFGGEFESILEELK